MTRFPLRDLAGADPYRLLGVPPTAGSDEITKAYKRRVRDVHPDLPDGSEEQTKLLHIAREILLDPALRAEYDRITDASGHGAAPWVGAPHDAPVPPSWIPPQRTPPGQRADLNTLSVLALVLAVTVPPVGIVIGIAALAQRPAPVGQQRTAAIVAIALGIVVTMCCIGYLAWIFP
jgi:hypothetical protein